MAGAGGGNFAGFDDRPARGRGGRDDRGDGSREIRLDPELGENHGGAPDDHGRDDFEQSLHGPIPNVQYRCYPSGLARVQPTVE